MAASTEVLAKPFIQKLYKMVDDPATAAIVDWTANGTAFQILQMEPFVQEQLPLYFKHANLSSLVRQLNTYGFSKVDNVGWVFAHPDFRRGELERLADIQRKNSSTTRLLGQSTRLMKPTVQSPWPEW